MSFDVWMLGLLALVLAAVVLHALVTGRFFGAARRTDPFAYWLGLAVPIVAGALTWLTWVRALGGAETARFNAAVWFAPYLLYLVIIWLRAGEIVWGNNRFGRRERPQPYWTILVLSFVGFVFFAGSLIYQELSGPL